MENLHTNLVENFLTYLLNEFKNDKHLRHVQFEKWSVDNYKVKIKYFYEGKEGNVFVDLRELQENIQHFSHLKENIIDQLSTDLNIHKKHSA